MAVSDYAVMFRGRRACPCLAEWLPVFEAELKRRGVIKSKIDIAQLIGGASASAGTHAQGGAFDIWQRDRVTLRIARDMGADASWERTPEQGFSYHCHGVLRGCTHNAPARYQITAVDGGYNGLGGGGRGGKDDGPKPLSKRTWKQGIAWAKTQGKPVEEPTFVPGMGKFTVTANPSLFGLLKPGSGNEKKTTAAKGSTLVTTGYAVVDGVRWYRALDGFYYSGQYLSAVDATPEESTVPAACTFNVLGFNIYASQYTGSKFSAARTAGLKSVNADARASLNLLSEINLDRDHTKMLEVLGKQFNDPAVWVKGPGNNHIYADRNKWTRTGSKIIDLIGRNQHRRVSVATYKHKASGVIVSAFSTHFSSAAWFRDNTSMSDTAASKAADQNQRAEAAALAKVIAGKPLPDWDPAKVVGYIDANRDDVMTWLKPAGFSELADFKIANAEYDSLHTLGKVPDKDGERIDLVVLGKKVTASNARQIVGQESFNASDHLPQASTITVTK